MKGSKNYDFSYLISTRRTAFLNLIFKQKSKRTKREINRAIYVKTNNSNYLEIHSITAQKEKDWHIQKKNYKESEY